MIIKSFSRKSRSFRQLAEYMAQGRGDKDRFVKNSFEDGGDLEAVSEEFLENSKHLTKRANGNFLFHEIIAVKPSQKLTERRTRKILQDLAERYLAARAPNQQVFGCIHLEKDHPHIHLMISANDVGDNKRKRLTPSQFNRIRQTLETYRLETWPELGDRQIYRQGRLSKQSEQSSPHFTKSEKETVKATLEVACGCQSEAAFAAVLQKAGLTLYQRGKQTGVVSESGRKYRFKTLHLDERHQEARARWTKTKSRLKQIQEAHQGRGQERTTNQDLERDPASSPDQDQKGRGGFSSTDPFQGKR